MTMNNGAQSPRFADRVVELRRVPADTIKPNPWNWRLHPQSQSDALMEVLEEVGFAGALIARETPGGLELIDGHLRQEVAGSDVVPVLVVDMTEGEVRRLLATLDPIGAMAQTDQVALAALLETLEGSGEATLAMLGELAVAAEPEEPEGPEEFPEIPGDIPTDYHCPSCGYEWSGKPK